MVHIEGLLFGTLTGVAMLPIPIPYRIEDIRS